MQYKQVRCCSLDRFSSCCAISSPLIFAHSDPPFFPLSRSRSHPTKKRTGSPSSRRNGTPCNERRTHLNGRKGGAGESGGVRNASRRGRDQSLHLLFRRYLQSPQSSIISSFFWLGYVLASTLMRRGPRQRTQQSRRLAVVFESGSKLPNRQEILQFNLFYRETKRSFVYTAVRRSRELGRVSVVDDPLPSRLPSPSPVSRHETHSSDILMSSPPDRRSLLLLLLSPPS